MTTAHEDKLKGGIAVITGAGSGIGSGLARRAGQLGMTVIVTDICTASATRVCQEIISAGGKAEAITVDVSVPSNLEKLAETVFTKHGSVRLLVNNAGIETLGFIWEIPEARWEAALNINVHGVIHSVRAFVPRMLTSGAECWIANLSSIGAFGMMPAQAAYMLTKHAVQSFTEALFLELQLKKAPIHVSSVMPGMVKTGIFAAEGGVGEPEGAARYRTAMREMMSNYGMDLDEGCKLIMEQVAAGKFWVSTQPEMTSEVLAGRAAFLTGQRDPEIAETARHLLGG
ncbi:hypothetical protein FQN53_005694 [Emmonsiellopsis sp. PD_33]|nr:hypothetical protein FQN53_005694 [Emmonsiellopsis sp. PD_33]